MGKLSNWLSYNTRKMPADVPRSGLGKWFQIVEERFMPLFWLNCVTMLWLSPCFVALFFLTQLWDVLSWALCIVFFALAGPGITALHFVCMKIVRAIPVWWWDDYKASVRRDWKKSIFLTFILGLLWSAFVFAVRIVLGADGKLGYLQLSLFALCGYTMTGVTVLSYLQLSNVELPLYNILKNSLLLSYAGKDSLKSVIFACVLALVAVRFYGYAPLAMLLGIYALAVMTVEYMFFPVFEAVFLKDKTDEE